VGATGSGRKLVGRFVGADLVVDEITAQARGAHAAFPDADTVIEIGGQDAKFIRLDEQGRVRDFEMNRACSAGTGSFLQEQSARLGVDLKADFARLALSAAEPTPLASRCTVFMESDLVHHVQQGHGVPGLLRGVADAVVENYLDRVARNRRPAKVVLQARRRNASVVEAFRRRWRSPRARAPAAAPPALASGTRGGAPSPGKIAGSSASRSRARPGCSSSRRGQTEPPGGSSSHRGASVSVHPTPASRRAGGSAGPRCDGRAARGFGPVRSAGSGA
jgi:predicted CoA-substrate-specific enzyme activase